MDRPRKDLKRGSLDDRGAPKQAASPAQEATRARISSLEAQLRRLKGGSVKQDQKATYQARCLEEELRKAYSKLRRLLNEAERQRRRRERLRGGIVLGGISSTPCESPADDAVMATLKSCTRFQDLVSELNALGFTLTQNDDFTDDGENSMPEVDGVKVEVELIEGDGEVETDLKPDTPSSSCSEIPALIAADVEDDGTGPGGANHENYRRWFERQAEAQQQWEERFMRERMDLARSILESVTATFLQGIQQVVESLTTGRRFPPYTPDTPPE